MGYLIALSEQLLLSMVGIAPSYVDAVSATAFLSRIARATPAQGGHPAGFRYPQFSIDVEEALLKIGSPEKVQLDLTACRSRYPAARKTTCAKGRRRAFSTPAAGIMLMEINTNGMLASAIRKPSSYSHSDRRLALFNFFS